MAVLGIGGLFFRARDPEALTAWYREHLGVGAGCAAPAAGEPEDYVWKVEGGPIAFNPFAANTDYFATDKAFMLNLRVSGLAGMIAALTAAGIAVETKDEWNDPAIGRFCRLHDPEGNPIELWEEPAG